MTAGIFDDYIGKLLYTLVSYFDLTNDPLLMTAGVSEDFIGTLD